MINDVAIAAHLLIAQFMISRAGYPKDRNKKTPASQTGNGQFIRGIHFPGALTAQTQQQRWLINNR